MPVEISTFGRTPRLTATYTRAADATAYTAGDNIGNSTTGANVVPITWDLSALISSDLYTRSSTPLSGKINAAQCVVAAASGTIVLTALIFDLYLFRPATNIPFTAGSFPADNAAMNFTAAAHRDLIGTFSFPQAGWKNLIGANAASGGYLWQKITATLPQTFNIDGLAEPKLRGMILAQGAWNPGAVAQQFDFALDVTLD